MSSAKVLICEDSPTYARALSSLLSHRGELDVVGHCSSGEELVEMLRRRAADLVVLDLELPGMSGQEVIEEIMRSPHPLPIVVLSGHVRHGSGHAEAALAAGALDALPKSSVRIDDPGGAASVALRHRLRRLARTSVAEKTEPVLTHHCEEGPTEASVIAIGASTGGPGTLATILSALPADFAVPVLVAQHMAEGFIEGLVDWIGSLVAVPVGLAVDGMTLSRGVWFAPDDAHLLLRPTMRLALDRTTEYRWPRPSADALLTSVASAAGSDAVGVVLTGMGRDGGDGVAALRRAGCHVIAQDEETSAVFGMPLTAIERGANIVLTLPEIGASLRGLRRTERSA